MDLREYMPLPDALDHWYYRSKFAALDHTLPWASLGTVLDFGCGRGVFSHLLKKRHPHLEITAYDPNGPEIRENDIQFTNRRPACKFDVILLMDVLEHVPDHHALLREVLSCCHSETRVFVTVPAFRSLWSGHDEYLGHHRRYTIGQLVAQARGAGFRVLHCHYLFTHLLLPALVRRRMMRRDLKSDMCRVPGWLNTFLYCLGRLESRLAPFNRIAGLTVVACLQP